MVAQLPWLAGVSGACSRAGKTALAVALLRDLGRSDVAAVKFTTTDDVFERCPRGTPCVVCDIDVPYRLIGDAATLGEPGTDTERLGAAAGKVLWCIARRGAVVEAWDVVRGLLRGATTVIEGSTIVSVSQPQLHLFVAHPFLSPQRWKPESAGLIATADVVVVNVPAKERRAPSGDVMQALRAARGRDDMRVADVTAPLVSWAPDISERMREAP